MQLAKQPTKSFVQSVGPEGKGPRLSLDIILSIFELLPLDKVFQLLEVGSVRETLVAQLNTGHLLKSRHLQRLIEYREIFERLTKLNVMCDTEQDIIVLETLCRWCPNLADLTLELDEVCMIYLKMHRHILRRLASLIVTLYDEESLFSLDEVCQKGSKFDLKLELACAEGMQHLSRYRQILERLRQLHVIGPDTRDLRLLGSISKVCPIQTKISLFRGSLSQSLAAYPEILRLLTSLSVFHPNAQDLPSLSDICEQYPITLDLHIEHLEEIINYPGVLKSARRLVVLQTVKKEWLGWLHDVCKRSPNLVALSFDLDGGLRHLMECSQILAPLTEINVALVNEEDCFRFKELPQQCQKLVNYVGTTECSFLKCLQDCPMLIEILMVGDSLTVRGNRLEHPLKVECELENLIDLAQVVNLQPLKRLELTSTYDDDETLTFPLLEIISMKSPNLEQLVINWRSERERSPEAARSLEKAIRNWESLQRHDTMP